ncbi:hypothetical protein BH24ACT5_BH24ACT5_10190 [soil metagenome]
MTTIVTPGGPVDPVKIDRRWWNPDITPAAGLKIAVAVLLFGGLVWYIGRDTVTVTIIRIAVAVGLSAALFIGANRLFDLAYDRWSLFNAIAGAALGFVTFAALAGNRVFTGLGGNVLIWGVIGAAIVGAGLFIIANPQLETQRLAVAVGVFSVVGVVIGALMNEQVHPDLSIAKFVVIAAIGAAVGGALRFAFDRSADRVLRGVLLGGALGALVGGWGAADIGTGNAFQAIVATAIPLALIGARVGSRALPVGSARREVELRSRSWIFLTPAMLFIAGGLIVPLVRTIYLSLLDQRGRGDVQLTNYRFIFTDDKAFNVSGWTDMFTSRLFWVAIVIVGLGVIAGVVAGRRTRQPFEASGVSSGPIFIGLFLLASAILTTLRGTLFNNLWWVIVVTITATAVGLAAAVLADRSRGENVAKALIFLPMAISFIGAGVIWRFMYIARNASKPQTGLLNAVWVGLGDLGRSTWPKAIVALLLVLIIAGLLALALQSVKDGATPRAGMAIGISLVLLFILFRLLASKIGGYETTSQGEVIAQPVDFIQESPFNNIWLMVVLIWIQTGFAMVILSSAIKGVPTELTEAARIDGANESQVFWKVIIPQIAPTIGVVVTTLIITVMKVFDIVKVMTNGNFDTQVIANDMFNRGIQESLYGLGSAFATVLFIAVLPVMYVNIRRMRRGQ